MTANDVEVYLDADEITGEVTSANTNRGRSIETSTFDAGRARVNVENLSANFNPYFLNLPGALLLESGDTLLLENGDRLLLESGNGLGSGDYGEIKVGRKLTIVDGGVTVFTGYVEDLDFSWDGDLKPSATIDGRDPLATLGATDLNKWQTTLGQLTGARVSAVLNRSEVGFPSGASFRDIASGTQPLQADLVDAGTNALRYLQQINETENGRLFADRTGKLIFQDRYEVFGVTPSASFNDTETALPFYAVDVRFGTELLHFQVSVDAGLDDVQTVTDSAAAAEYPTLGKRNLGRRTLHQLNDHAAGLAQFLVDRLSSVGAVVSGLTVWLNELSVSDRATVCALDIGDVISLTWTPQGSSGPVNQILVIEGVSYSLAAQNAWMTFQLSDASDPGYFVVDTDSVGGAALVAP